MNYYTVLESELNEETLLRYGATGFEIDSESFDEDGNFLINLLFEN